MALDTLTAILREYIRSSVGANSTWKQGIFKGTSRGRQVREVAMWQVGMKTRSMERHYSIFVCGACSRNGQCEQLSGSRQRRQPTAPELIMGTGHHPHFDNLLPPLTCTFTRWSRRREPLLGVILKRDSSRGSPNISLKSQSAITGETLCTL